MCLGAELRRAGHEPDAVLMPLDVRLQAMLSSHPAWQWNRDLLGENRYRAILSGVPVYEAGPQEATTVVVCELGAAVRRVERRRPGEASPVGVDVESIDHERARVLLDAGTRSPGVGDDRAAQEATLVNCYVEVRVDVDVEFRAPEGKAAAARRVQLPPQDERRRHRD